MSSHWLLLGLAGSLECPWELLGTLGSSALTCTMAVSAIASSA